MVLNTPPISEVRYGIIGCGMMGQEHLRNIALLPGASVTRIFSLTRPWLRPVWP